MADVDVQQHNGGEDSLDDDDDDDSAFQRAWMAAQEQAMRAAGLEQDVSGLSSEEIDAMAERAFALQQAKDGQSGVSGERSPTTLANLSMETGRVTNLPAHWEGFITDMESVWDIRFSDLKFGEQIGVGAFGSVHKGTYFGTSIAVKTVFTEGDETNLMYLMREINVLKGCRHPHIVQFMGISNDSTNALLHIVTEYVKDGDLRNKLKEPKVKIPWDLRAKVARDLASAMAYLHSNNIIHRDLKSKNILVDSNWDIKLCDFGFARTCEQKKRPMTLCGTEAWMAPEIIVGQPYGPAADVFSYGIVLCEIVSRGKVSHTLTRNADDGFCFSVPKYLEILPPDCPEDFKSAITEACAYEPENRPGFTDLSEHFELLHKDLDVERTGKTPEVSSALAKFRNAAAALTAPLIEKGTIRERRNGLQRKVAEEVEEPKLLKAVPLREQKSTRRVQVNPRVSAVHQLIDGNLTAAGRRSTAPSSTTQQGGAPAPGRNRTPHVQGTTATAGTTNAKRPAAAGGIVPPLTFNSHHHPTSNTPTKPSSPATAASAGAGATTPTPTHTLPPKSPRTPTTNNTHPAAASGGRGSLPAAGGGAAVASPTSRFPTVAPAPSVGSGRGLVGAQASGSIGTFRRNQGLPPATAPTTQK
eukprot:TRINITY_DN146_c0_g1_i2.p1 TRINITY_DN146_c0_g1~~TRINITY_DN146_c0_g1_i2.p1  ORF type:complete len:642 (-),score=121.19 TRINITY_DN146_c0_g1_i2:75-2000(-)